MDFFSKIGPGDMIPLLAIAVGGLVAITAIIAGCLSSNAKLRHDADLRKNLLDRGMSAAEVEMAMRGFGATQSTASDAEESLGYDTELAKYLAIPGKKGVSYSPEAINCILRAFRPLPASEKEPIYTAILGMIEERAGEEQLIAAVRGLCCSTILPANAARELSNSEMVANLPLQMRQ